MSGTRVLLDVSLGELATRISRVIAKEEPRSIDVGMSSIVGTGLEHANVLIAGVGDADRAAAVRRLVRIKDLLPHVSLLLVSEAQRAHSDMRAYALAGVEDHFVLSQTGSFESLAKVVGARMRAPPPKRALRLAYEMLAPQMRPYGLWPIATAYRRRTEDDLARLAGRSREAVSRRIAKLGLPHFPVLRRIGQVVLIGELHERYDFSIAHAARRIGLRDASGCWRSVGVWREARDSGEDAASTVGSAFSVRNLVEIGEFGGERSRSATTSHKSCIANVVQSAKCSWYALLVTSAQRTDPSVSEGAIMKSIVLKFAVVLVMASIFVSSPAPATETLDRCNEWVPCSGGCCDDDTVCNLLCPSWIAAVCDEGEIYCLNHET